MSELTFEKKKITRYRNIFPAQANIVEVVRLALEAKIAGEIRIGLPGNGGVNFIEFLEKEKTETVFYEPYEENKLDTKLD